MSLSEKQIDKRILRRTLDRGVVSRADFEQHLSQLPDLSHNVQKPEAPEAEGKPPESESPL